MRHREDSKKIDLSSEVFTKSYYGKTGAAGDSRLNLLGIGREKRG